MSDDERVSVVDEVAYIRECASTRKSRIVTLGKLMLFSTAGGDAWILDTSDKRATMLVDTGESYEVNIRETGETTVIAWEGRYRIDGIKFIYIDDGAFDLRSWFDYPVQQIAKNSAASASAVTSKERESADLLRRMLHDTGRDKGD